MKRLGEALLHAQILRRPRIRRRRLPLEHHGNPLLVPPDWLLSRGEPVQDVAILGLQEAGLLVLVGP